MRHALLVAVPVHVIDQPADIFAGQIAFQRPGRIGVAERGRQVRACPNTSCPCSSASCAKSTVRPSTLTSRPPSTCRTSPVAVTMMSASSSLPSFSLMPFLVKVSISLVTTEARLSRIALEQVAVGHQAQPLIPGIVARREMRGDVVVRTERHLDAAEDQLLDAGRLAPAELEEIHAQQHVAPADQMIGELGRQSCARSLLASASCAGRDTT